MDQELYIIISEAKKGKKEAFAQLLTHYKGQVFRHAFAMLGDRMEAEDISQEAFIKVYYSLNKLESEYAFTSWLTRIVSRLCYDRIQKRRKETTMLFNGRLKDVGEPDQIIERTQLQLTITEAMAKISPEHREAIVLRDVEGYSYEEIAKILEIPLGTVKSRINAARLALRNVMNSSGKDD